MTCQSRGSGTKATTALYTPANKHELNTHTYKDMHLTWTYSYSACRYKGKQGHMCIHLSVHLCMVISMVSLGVHSLILPTRYIAA